MADLHHLGRARGPAARRRAARAVRPRRRGRRSRPPTYSGGMRRRLDLAMTPGRRPADHLPRRADHRPRPAQPPHHVADHPRPRRRRRHDLPHHPVPGGGRPARRPDRGPRPRQAGRRGHRRTSSSGCVPGGHIRLRFADAGELDSAARALGEVDPRRRRAHPAGPERRRRPVAARPARPARRRSRSRSTSCRVHTPDLDDVFLALTGHPDNEKETSPMSTLSYAVTRLGDDAAPQPPAHAALPVHDADARRHAGRLPAAVRLRLRRHARRRARRRRPAAAPSTSTTSLPGSC